MLTRTHLSPTTGKRERCTASVRACRFGGHELVDAAAPSMAEFYAQTPAAQVISHPVVNRALNAPLDYAGPKPTWWTEHAGAAAKHPTMPTTVELLDVVDTPAGKVAVVWQEHSHRDKDEYIMFDSGVGVHNCRYLDFESGKELGYLNLAYMSQATMAASFGEDEFWPFRFAERYGEGNFKLQDYNVDGPGHVGLTGEALLAKRREVWLRAHQVTGSGYTTPDGESLASYQVDAKHIPDDATVAKDLAKLHRELARKAKSHAAYFTNPHVDYSRVEGALGGKGYGSALYIYAARHLGRRGLGLRGSGIQSGQAQGVWKRFQKQLPQHVVRVTKPYRGRRITSRVLSFAA